MAHSDHGIIRDKRAEDQPRDKQRAHAVGQGSLDCKDVPNRQDKSRETASKFGVTRKQVCLWTI